MYVVAETREHIGRGCSIDVHGDGHGPAVADAQVVSKLKVSDAPRRAKHRKNSTGCGSNSFVHPQGVVEEMYPSGIEGVHPHIRAGSCRNEYRVVLNGDHWRRRRSEGAQENAKTTVGTLQTDSVPTNHGPAKRNGPRTLQNNPSLRK